MKSIRLVNYFIMMVITGLVACQGNAEKGKSGENSTSEEKIEKGTPVIEFEVESYDFGEIAPGEKVSYTFKYTNTGDANLVVQSATAGCGCTVPKWNKDPLPPGEKGFVEVVFDSSGRKGKQIKQVTIKTNGNPAVRMLQIQANIVEPNS